MSEPYSHPRLELAEHEERTVCEIQEELIGLRPELALAENASELVSEAQKLYQARMEAGEYGGEYFS